MIAVRFGLHLDGAYTAAPEGGVGHTRHSWTRQCCPVTIENSITVGNTLAHF